MKTKVLMLCMALMGAMVFFSGCKKDEDKDNPCAGITCENGGTCNSGTCDCPSGYTGSRCQTAPNPCASVTCLNGGTCVSGNCNCPTGYTGSRCETYNACAGVNCLNGGTCNNGTCNCPTGYTGTNCGTQRTPTKIRIVKIEVNTFPATDNGAGWDLTSGADIYPAIYQVSPSAFVWESDTFIENAASNLVHTFIPNPPVLTNPNVEYLFALFDYDYPDPDDAIGGVSLVIDYNGFPEIIDVTVSDISFTVYVEYVF